MDKGLNVEDTAERIFWRALELPQGEERMRYLDSVCQSKAQVRERVEALLDSHRNMGGFLEPEEQDPPGAVASATNCTATAPLAEDVGTMIGRYKLLQKLGEGGFGVVYLAEQKEPVKRRVALKIIKLGMDTKQVVARFEAERQALALMDHSNIARVFDAGATDTGRPYFVMELVRGVPITKYSDQNRLPTRERLDLFIAVCHAVQHAHQKGIIHRDLKPSNILVTLHDGVPVPKVIDFGIAKATQQELTEKTVFTQFQQMIGTPSYMSPEQTEMSGLDIDTRTDIYSLGVLLYEMLTGKTPLDPKKLAAGGYEEIRRRIKEEEPPKPSTRARTLVGEERTTVAKHRGIDPARLGHELKGDLDWIVMKALEKDRNRRYPTANGLALDIKRFLQNEPVTAAAPSRLYRARKYVRRHRAGLGVAAAVAGLLVLGTVASTWQAVRATRAEQAQSRLRDAAETARADEEAQRKKAEAYAQKARQRTYIADVNLAQRALEQDNIGRARQLLDRQRPEPGQTDLRGWEWRFLRQQCRSDALLTLCQQPESILSLAVSQDGKWLAVLDAAGLSIWDLRTQQRLNRLATTGPGNGRSIVFCPTNPSWLAFWSPRDPISGEELPGIRLWDVVTKQVMATLPISRGLRGLDFSGDGQTLVASTPWWNRSDSEQLILWSVPEGKRIASHRAEQVGPGTGAPFALASDLTLAAHGLRESAAPGGWIRLLNPVSGQELWHAQASQRGWIESLALSPDKKILASSSGLLDSAIRLWAVDSGQQIARLEGHRAYVIDLLFWPNGKRLASASADQTIRLWDLSDPSHVPEPRVLRGHGQEVWRLALLPDQATLVSGSKDGTVLFWDATINPPSQDEFTLDASPWLCWHPAPDGSGILSCDRTGEVARWTGTGATPKQVLLQVGPDILKACISQEGRWLASSHNQGSLKIWDLQERVLSQTVTNLLPSTSPVRFQAQGRILLVLDEDLNTYRQWDLATSRELRSWNKTGGREAFSQDGYHYLALQTNGMIYLRDVVSGTDTNVDLKVNAIWQMAFSPDGTLFAIASAQGYAKVWQRSSLTLVATLRGNLLGAHSVSFTPDGRRLLIGSSGGEAIRVWDLENQQELITLKADGSQLENTLFSLDGSMVCSRDNEGKLHCWRAAASE